MLLVFVVKDDNVLDKMIGKKVLDYYGNLNIIGWYLVGGSLYVFDFNNQVMYEIFNYWCKVEDDGVFGS